MIHTAHDTASDGIFVIDQRDPPPSRPRRGRHRRRPERPAGGWGALALCGATALAAAAVVVWTAALPVPFDLPAVFSGSGMSGSPALELEVQEPADAVSGGLGAGDEPGAGATGPDRTDPGAPDSEKLPQ